MDVELNSRTCARNCDHEFNLLVGSKACSWAHGLLPKLMIAGASSFGKPNLQATFSLYEALVALEMQHQWVSRLPQLRQVLAQCAFRDFLRACAALRLVMTLSH